ncbi:MAG TPA: Zn-dependent alcohol dehydrogenase [Chloroflexota bacterium]|nr:Zn-dependent alcohol dehydrogenase [Chloroflexota bacterium]
MKAAVMYERRKPMIVQDLELTEPGPGEVEINLSASGVCHSDFNHWQRDTATPLPVVLGHEGAGVVKAVGANVSRVKVGDHVIIAFGPKCGECYYCVRGMPYLCTPANPARPRLSRDGKLINQFLEVSTYAERTVVSEKNVVKIRDDAPLAACSLVACGVTTGIGAVINTAQVEPGSNVLVIGTGGVGLNAVQGAKLAGAARVIAVDIRDNKLEFAREMGATHLINASREDVVERVKALTGGYGVDYAFEVIGNPKTISQAYDSVRKGGTAVVVGVADETAELTIQPVWMMRQAKTLMGCAYGSARPQVDFPRIVDLYMEGRIKLDELITREFALDDINEAFRALDAGEVARGILRLN